MANFEFFFLLDNFIKHIPLISEEGCWYCYVETDGYYEHSRGGFQYAVQI